MMKKQAYKLMALFVLVGSMALAAQAQSSGGKRLIANIPFEFTAGNKTLPAAEYTVEQVNAASDHAVLRLRTRDGRVSVLLQTTSISGKADESAKLIFNRYDDKYFFGQAWLDGDGTGMQAPKPRAERLIERELAGARTRKETIALTTRR
jgi:hypothetical protein